VPAGAAFGRRATGSAQPRVSTSFVKELAMRQSKFGLIGVAALVSVLGVAAVIAEAQQTGSGPKVALVIGNATYPDDNKPLAEPVKDARALADELRRDGFDVVVAEDLTKQKMRSEIDAFKAKIKPGAAALLFFSGYGIQTAKQSYLIPVDAQIWTEGEVKRDGISIESILSAMDAAGASIKVVILDAARRNPFERRFRGYSAGLASLNAPVGTLAIYSAAPDKVSSESNDGRSLFVTELLKEMRAPKLSAEDVFNHTRVNVSRASRNEQVPSVSSSLTETFNFAGAPPPAAAESRPPAPESRPSASLGPGPTAPPERPKAPAPGAKKETPPAEPANSAEDFNKRGRTYAVNGDYASADADFSEAIRRNSKYAAAFNNRCWTRAVMGQAEDAIADCDQAIRLRVDYADAFDSRGLAYLKLGKFDRAIADFDAALRLRPKQASSLYGRGLAELKKGQTSAGNADLAEAKRIDPGIVQEYEHYGVE
jgi:tetratricopeptide (TPR) repeat protein